MINRVVLVGRLVRDPDVRKTSSGTSVVSFTIAVDNKTKEKSTSFIPVTAWSSTADIVSRFLKKGNLCGVDGRLNQRTYDSKDGRKVSVVEVIAESVQLLERKSDNGSSPLENAFDESHEPSTVEGIGTDETSDDLPF